MGTGKSPAAKASGGKTAALKTGDVIYDPKTKSYTPYANPEQIVYMDGKSYKINSVSNRSLGGDSIEIADADFYYGGKWNNVKNTVIGEKLAKEYKKKNSRTTKMTPNQKARSIATASQRQEMNNLDKKYAVGNEMPKTSRVAGTVTKAPTYGVDDQGRITVAWESQYKFLGATTTTQWSAILVDGGKNSPAKLWKIQHTQTHSIDKKKRTKNGKKQT